MKLLIDECLSPELARMAVARGYGETSHVVWMKLGGLKDWELKPIILDGDWTFVTKNSVDFRGPREKVGSKGQYADVAIHAGLICLNGPPGMDLDCRSNYSSRHWLNSPATMIWSIACWRFLSNRMKNCAFSGTLFRRNSIGSVPNRAWQNVWCNAVREWSG